MRKLILLLPALLLISTIQLSAQESIGYSDSTDFQYLIDYRLPDWGYSNFSISSAGFSSNGTYSFIDQESSNPLNRAETDRANHNTNIGFAPRYELYRESELRTFSLDMISGISTNFSNSKQDNISGSNTNESEGNFNGQSIQSRVSLAHNYYTSDNVFLITNLFADIRYRRDNAESEIDGIVVSEVTSIERSLNFTPTLGIGFGRIRNVTPIIRAIRFNERYKELESNSLSGNEIQNTADSFTRIQGYRRTTDRFQKYFWDDINNGLNGKLDQIGAFDLFYLNDVFDENLGSRFEGYEAAVSVDYSYVNRLTKQDDHLNNTETRIFSLYRQANLNFNIDWFKNIDLYNQLSIRTYNSLILPLEESDQEEWANQTDITAEWLWIFADRFTLDTNLQTRYSTRKLKQNTEDKFGVLSSVLRTNLFYFVENKIAINTGVSLAYNGSNREFLDLTVTDKRFQWSVNAGIKYYFDRNLY
ncbi:hypothetical protein A8B79_01825 [Balneola sp. EhC07]|uniref:hypothetical protein n=1 Tax=Balneola sp. EhC07 TaxID=1849360 RepID=UPI0007F489BD|nr:hypothetical protein [Balneola sp. EhC07]OAN62990.1 hypothetical protein A8B79_01825 [Balneola sp. EhC07]